MRHLTLLIGTSLLLAACAGEQSGLELPSVAEPEQIATEQVQPSPEAANQDPTSVPSESDSTLLNPRIDDPNRYSFPRLLGLDAIAPVYDPIFLSAHEAPLRDEELIMGVAHQGEAKAYPISVLRFREMANDELGDLPILVTW